MHGIVVSDVSKRFKVYKNRTHSLKEKILRGREQSSVEYWALKNISFTVGQGETLALVGKNGAGKSTLLKLLSKIIYPTTGHISMNGRVAGLLELGAGFHPDFTGKENIYINASILGFTQREIEEKIDEIIDFSEIREFIDTPVRNYSSGMYMRLAFSVAITVRPEIFLIDEVLSVGDLSFQQKCLERLRELKRSGMTIVVVSHATTMLEELCDRVIWIHDGTKWRDGPTASVIAEYSNYMTSH